MIALLVLLAGAGAWALLGGDDQGGNTQNGDAGRQEQGKAAAPQQETGEEPAKETGGTAQKPSEGSGSSGGAPEENPAPPLVNAEQTVYDLYYEMSFNRVGATWALLSPRLQNEIGSPEQWEEQQDIYTFTFMKFTAYPVASAAGDTAEVSVRGEVGSHLGIRVPLGHVGLRQRGRGVEAGPPGERAEACQM